MDEVDLNDQRSVLYKKKLNFLKDEINPTIIFCILFLVFENADCGFAVWITAIHMYILAKKSA